jgi:hypothetical protein
LLTFFIQPMSGYEDARGGGFGLMISIQVTWGHKCLMFGRKDKICMYVEQICNLLCKQVFLFLFENAVFPCLVLENHQREEMIYCLIVAGYHRSWNMGEARTLEKTVSYPTLWIYDISSPFIGWRWFWKSYYIGVDRVVKQNDIITLPMGGGISKELKSNYIHSSNKRWSQESGKFHW